MTTGKNIDNKNGGESYDVLFSRMKLRIRLKCLARYAFKALIQCTLHVKKLRVHAFGRVFHNNDDGIDVQMI